MTTPDNLRGMRSVLFRWFQWSDLYVCIHSERNAIQLLKYTFDYQLREARWPEIVKKVPASSVWHDERDKPAEANITESKLSIVFSHLRTMFFFFSHFFIRIDICFPKIWTWLLFWCDHNEECKNVPINFVMFVCLSECMNSRISGLTF
jgi:hypothetical protein